MDEESVIDAHLEYNGAWERFNIVKPKRQEWIIQRARAAARDYEIKSCYKFSKGEFDRVVMSGVNCLAEQYYNMSRKKISSQASTSLTGIYMEMANTSSGVHAIDYSHDLGTPQTENKGVRFETEALKGDRGQTTPPMDPTTIARTIVESGEDSWPQRYDKMLRREGEIKMFGFSNIPDQGILFEGYVPIDAWKYPKDGERVRRQQSTQAEGTPSSGGSSPPPVLSKDEEPRNPQTSGASNSTFNTSY
jgi:hypothetical protein